MCQRLPNLRRGRSADDYTEEFYQLVSRNELSESEEQLVAISGRNALNIQEALHLHTFGHFQKLTKQLWLLKNATRVDKSKFCTIQSQDMNANQHLNTDNQARGSQGTTMPRKNTSESNTTENKSKGT